MSRSVIPSRRFLLVCFLTASGAFLIGSSDWTARLMACNGSVQSCLGGCMYIIYDGAYVDFTTCDQVQNNNFRTSQAVLARSWQWPSAGPNVEPVQDGNPNWTDDNTPPDLPCDTTAIQEGDRSASIQSTIQIPHTICPP